MTMKCNQCRFYEPNPAPWGWRGSCDIKLPPMVEALFGDGRPDRTTRGDSGCDLGQPIEAEPYDDDDD
jgi:hypothetical protein